MRLLAALIFAVNAWPTTCATPPPCSVITPGLTVLLAEAAETRLADPAENRDWMLVPVHMKLRTLLYGKSPGREFTFHASAVNNIRAGDVFYVEAASLKDFRFRVCGISGPYDENAHAPRVKYFREFSEGKHREASLLIGAIDHQHRALPGVEVHLFSRSAIMNIQTNARGRAEWKSLPPGRYRISATKQDYSLIDPGGALTSIEIPIGGCLRREVTLRPGLF